ncbi:MAG: glycyl-radical enzyme activating protein [Ruminococcaceae bacterium]|nr:glycyl-radical enzyme activating protein [Oscillospiraceae bacterium]
MKGLIFDIKQFSVNDGEGIRETVFFKGCPLRCIWCHNPEGLLPSPELYERREGCLSCGLCRVPCEHEECRGYGRCLHICPQNLLREVGRYYEAEELAERLLSQKAFLDATGGGVTLSGGEPLLQADFCTALLSLLKGRLHLAIETSGYAPHADFVRVISLCDFVMMDLKLMDEEAHRRYTGVSNQSILENARWLKESGIPFVFRTPLIPGITDTEENLSSIAAFAGNSPVELLPYNPLAGAKYASVHRTYTGPSEKADGRIPELSVFENVRLRKK